MSFLYSPNDIYFPIVIFFPNPTVRQRPALHYSNSYELTYFIIIFYFLGRQD